MKQNIQSKILRLLVYFCASLTAIATIAIVAKILISGVPNLHSSLFAFKYNSENASVFPALVNTVWMTAITLLLAVPVGIASAIYLVEYAKRGSIYVKIIRLTTETLSGIPSIIYGLFGFLFFATFLKMGYSILAGCCTLAIMVLPVIIRTTEEALLAVPDSLREASFGLGAGKLRTVFKIVLPQSLHGIAGGLVLSIGRIVGETAALIYTAGTVAQIPEKMNGSGRTLSVHLYALWTEGLAVEKSYATAVILLLVVLVLNFVTEKIYGKIK